MPCYIISYDLRQPGRDYDPLYEAIKAYGTWAHINESVWAVVTTQTAVQVRDNLSQHAHPNDRLFVIRSGAEAAWSNPMCKNEWLKEHL
jgi:hypothetical protein